MFYNYLLVAFRNLTRQFSYSLINITGLATGLACSMVIFAYVYGEWSYDRHFERAQNIYKVGISFFNMGGFGVGPEALGDILPKEFDGVEAFTRVLPERNLLIDAGKHPVEELAYYTDSSFFRVFSYEFIKGNRTSALRSNSSIVLSERLAQKYFPGQEAVGRMLMAGKDKKQYLVTGVVRNDRRNSQLKAELWLSIDDQLSHETRWTSASCYNYVLLKERSSLNDLHAALDRILQSHVYPVPMGVPADITFEDYKKHPNAVHFHVHPLTEVHLHSSLLYEISPGGNEFNLYIFTSIALCVLMLAVVNFINLTTARSSRRAREIGIRKVIGSSKQKLVFQFMLESVMMSLIALIVSVLIGMLFLEAFEAITGETLVDNLFTGLGGILLALALALTTGLVAGIYPALYLTSFSPLKVLKSHWTTGGSSGFRDAMVVTQFTIAIGLMIGALIVFRQMDYMKNLDLGFDQQHIVTIDNMHLAGKNAETFKNELAAWTGVSSASLHSGEPGSQSVVSFSVFKTPAMAEGLSIHAFQGDAAFLKTMGLQLTLGRDFNDAMASDSSAVILNEEAVKALQLEQPIGADLGYGRHVIGVVRDFHWESLRNKIAPTAITAGKKYLQLAVRLRNDNTQRFLDMANTKWKKLVPEEPIKYHFLDENFGSMLKKEQVFEKAIGFSMALAIFISCLGLFGLSAYTIVQRRKEIGIRKVMGAGAVAIVLMLNKRFSLLVAIASVIAVPVAIWAMQRWTSGFAFHAELNLLTLVLTVAGAFALAIITVSFYAVKGAMTDPAETLRDL